MSSLTRLFFAIIVSLMTMSAARAQGVSSPSTQASWAVSMDNDLFSPFGNDDADFTGGFALTYLKQDGFVVNNTLAKGLSWFDQLLVQRVEENTYKRTSGVELGLYGFTPSKVEAEEVLYSDRPYASLLYVSSSQTYRDLKAGSSRYSSLTLGALGLDLFGSIQNRIHQAIDGDPANGWGHQISEGGEPTFRYQLAFSDYWNISKASQQPNVKTTYFSSVGYLTEVGVALSSAFGLISNPSDRFNPELISYGERVNDLALDSYVKGNRYFWAGASIKFRLYNAFLQGQFRDSVHTLSSAQLENWIAEAWVGYTYGFNEGLSLSYFMRWQSSEIRSRYGGRDLIWGGFILSRQI